MAPLEQHFEVRGDRVFVPDAIAEGRRAAEEEDGDGPCRVDRRPVRGAVQPESIGRDVDEPAPARLFPELDVGLEDPSVLDEGLGDDLADVGDGEPVDGLVHGL